MNNYNSEIYDDQKNRRKREERFHELTKAVIQIVHPLLNPIITTPEQARMDYYNNPRFNCVCRSIVEFVMTEKPDAEEQLRQTIEVEHLIKNTNLFLNGK